LRVSEGKVNRFAPATRRPEMPRTTTWCFVVITPFFYMRGALRIRQTLNLEMSAFPLGECQQRRIRQLAGVQPFSERKALSACQVERQRRLDDGSRRLEYRGGTPRVFSAAVGEALRRH